MSPIIKIGASIERLVASSPLLPLPAGAPPPPPLLPLRPPPSPPLRIADLF